MRSILFLVLCLGVLLKAQAEDKIMTVFVEQSSPVAAQGSLDMVDGAKSVTINRALKSATVGQNLLVELPDGNSLSLQLTKKERKPNRTVVIQATDANQTRLIITLGKRRNFGSINGPGFSYTLGFSKKSGQILMDNDKSRASEIRLDNDMRFPPRTSNKLRLPPQQQTEQLETNQTDTDQQTSNQTDTPEPQATVAAPADMTLLVVYSPEFAAGFGDPVSRIEQAIAFTNQALSDTGVDGQFRLVGAQEIDFDNSLTAGTLLTQATNGSNAFSSLPALRNEFGADMVSVLAYRSDFAPNSDFAANGIAWVNGDNPNFAFSVTRLAAFCCDSVFAHELGHNLGSGHERASVSGNSGGSCDDSFQPGGFTGFSCGHGVNGNFDTIMSRNVGASINRFSNPNQSCNGVPCGIAQSQQNSADNFTSFNISAFLIEQFRANIITPRSGDVVIPPILNLLLDEE